MDLPFRDMLPQWGASMAVLVGREYSPIRSSGLSGRFPLGHTSVSASRSGVGIPRTHGSGGGWPRGYSGVDREAEESPRHVGIGYPCRTRPQAISRVERIDLAGTIKRLYLGLSLSSTVR